MINASGPLTSESGNMLEHPTQQQIDPYCNCKYSLRQARIEPSWHRVLWSIIILTFSHSPWRSKSADGRCSPSGCNSVKKFLPSVLPGAWLVPPRYTFNILPEARRVLAISLCFDNFCICTCCSINCPSLAVHSRTLNYSAISSLVQILFYKTKMKLTVKCDFHKSHL